MNGGANTSADREELWGGFTTGLYGEDCSWVYEPMMMAAALGQGVEQPLTAAWLELDGCRLALESADHAETLGRLELVGALLSEAVFNLLSATAKCRTAGIAGARAIATPAEVLVF